MFEHDSIIITNRGKIKEKDKIVFAVGGTVTLTLPTNAAVGTLVHKIAPGQSCSFVWDGNQWQVI
jgi:hypothetical protein